VTSTELTVIGYNAQQTHAAIAEQVWPWVKAQNMGGHAVVVRAMLLEDHRSIQRNKEYWGYVLRPISEQVQDAGMGATVDGWHDYYRLMFLGYEFKTVRLPGKKRPSVRKALRSTTKLSERAMRKYCEQIRAHAATSFGVTFPAMEQDTGPVQKGIAGKPKTTIDMETGEIVQ